MSYKHEYIDCFDEITNLYESGVTLGDIYQKLSSEGKITSPIEHFKNMHSQITAENIEELRKDVEKKTQHQVDFSQLKDCIHELIQTGLSYERIYMVLRKSDKIKMSMSFFRTLGIDAGIYKPREMFDVAVRPTEIEFLNYKYEIIRRMEKGLTARKVYEQMYEAGKLAMSFSTYRNYCMKHGVEMRKKGHK